MKKKRKENILNYGYVYNVITKYYVALSHSTLSTVF